MHDPDTVTLDSEPMTPAQVVAVARHRATLELGSAAARRVGQSRATLEALITGGRPVYGLNTSLGASVDTPLGGADMVSFQRRVGPSHSVGVGPLLPAEAVRAMMAARISGAVAGGTGMSPGVVWGLLAALNAGVHPLVPAWGSVGAADLAPLAHMTRALAGEGEAEFGGDILPAAEAIARAGLAPLDIREKDGHALVVANSLSTGTACLVLADVERFIDWSLTAVALSYEGFRSSLSALDDSGMAARPAFGQREAAGRLRSLLEGSALWQDGAARRLQDPLSFRCASQVWGAALHAQGQAVEATAIELAHSGDNPVILVEEDRAVANGNFDMTAFSLAWEQLGQALAHCASAIVNRCAKLMSPGFTGMPRFLAARGQNYMGYAQLQKTLSALEAESRHLANPISLTPMPISDWSEDQSSMAPRVVAKTGEIVERLRYLVAIELMTACTAIELRDVVGSLGPRTADAFAMVRRDVPALDDDRALSVDMEALAKMMKAGPSPSSAS
ncbi:MAG: histidine ammonia-lyase [Mesorhizobium amorphae]|nr:MAG: histidine ammonia-lyase [Mesorhizobium amorphae]